MFCAQTKKLFDDADQIQYCIYVCGYHLVCVYWHILDTVAKLCNTIYFAFKRFEIHFRNPLLFARILWATCCGCLLQLKLFPLCKYIAFLKRWKITMGGVEKCQLKSIYWNSKLYKILLRKQITAVWEMKFWPGNESCCILF